jgi:starch synthase
MRVVGVGITPPVYKASGGISAGIQLMERVARLTDTRMFLMSDRDEDVVENGLALVRRRPGNLLRSFKGVLPRQLVTLMWRPRLRAWLAANRPSLVHFHNPHPPGALLEAAKACRQLGIPYVISTHGFVEMNDVTKSFGGRELLRPVYDRLIRGPIVQVVQHAAQVLMLSPQEEPILRGMGARPEQLSVVTNGVDPYFLEPVSVEVRSALVARFQLPSGVPLMLFVGNHTPNKGLDVLLRALPKMRERGVAVVAGAITSRPDHVRMVAQADIGAAADRLIFTDFITKEELRALYQSVDLFVFPSRADTLPLVILEAMASGLPVVSTTVGGIPFEVCEQTGVLVPPGEPAALAAALDSLCAAPAARAAMGEAARSRVRSLFDWKASAVKSLAIYRRVLAGASGR